MGKEIYGLGILDVDCRTQIHRELPRVNGKRIRKLEWVCPHYQRWKNMVQRVSYGNNKNSLTAYEGTSICEEWIYFSKFKEWMETQENLFGEEEIRKRTLDKDILIPGNREYSPEACCFALQETNKFILHCKKKKEGLPLGTYWSERRNKFVVKIGNGGGKSIFVGHFDCPEEAHIAWVKAKLKQAKEITQKEVDPRIEVALVKYFEDFLDFPQKL